MLLSASTDLAEGPSHRKLPSLERAGLRPFLESIPASQVAREMVQPRTPVIDYVRCRSGDHDVCIDALTPEDRQAHYLYQSCHRCTLGGKPVTPLTSMPTKPMTMYDELDQLSCSTPSSSRRCTSNSSVCSIDSTDRKRRRRSVSEAPASPKITLLTESGVARPRLSPEVRKEKKEKEQDARNGQKEQVKEMEDLVIKYLGSEGMTELNQNNSKTSGLKYKKVEVHKRAVTLIKSMARRIDDLEAEEESDKKQILDLQTQLKETRCVPRWIYHAGSTGPTSARGSRL